MGTAAGSNRATIPTSASEAKRLEIRLIGEVAVRRGDEQLALPRSRKCRALIAYLAAIGRPQRRERLCELFWDIPDDPKGELRWSLSKVRRVLGDALLTDGDTVAIDPAVEIDAVALRAAAERPDSLVTADLERLADRDEGVFGAGLELARCPDFLAWLYAAREDHRRAQRAVLDELVRRLADDPERALPHARARVAGDPLDEQARLDLLALLTAAGRAEEAKRQRALGVEALRDAGIRVPQELARPSARTPAPAAATPDRPGFQRIQFCASADGTRIAWSAVGGGPPLIKTANWMGHLEFEWESPLLRHWLAELSRARLLVRYDTRGNGLSDRRAQDLSLEAFVQDLEAVTANIAEQEFDLIGISQGAPVAIAFAARHPQRIRKLVLFGGFAMGWRHSSSEDVKARWSAMITLTRIGWGTNNPAFRQMFTSLFVPRATPDQADWFNALQLASASPEESQRLQQAIGDFDVRHLLPLVRAPTIVFHCRDDAMVPFAAGRHLATNIAGAEFVGLDSDNHLPLEDEPAWAVFVDRLRDFLAR